MTREEKVAKLSEIIFARSNEAYAKYYPKDEDTTTYSEKAVKIAEFIKVFPVSSSDFKRSLKQLMELAIDEELPRVVKEPEETDIDFVPGTCIVPTDCRNSHNYEVGAPVIVVKGESGISRSQPKGGNGLDDSVRRNRLATLEEITPLVSELYETIEKKFFIVEL